LVKALSELRTDIVNNRHLIPNYGERYRNGELIATGFVESTVNEVVSKRFCKRQQMAWSKEGAHLLLQTRVRTLNGELVGIFKRWYPDLDIKAKAIPIEALSPGSPCSPHSGRRTFITWAAGKVSEVGGSVRDVQQLAGHASMHTTPRYIEGDSDAKRKLVGMI